MCCRTHGARGLPSTPFSHSFSGICLLSSAGSGRGSSSPFTTVSTGLPSRQHCSTSAVPIAISCSGGDKPSPSLHLPSTHRRIVPRLTLFSLIFCLLLLIPLTFVTEKALSPRYPLSRILVARLPR